MYTKYSTADIDEIVKSHKTVYFIGIGGISMSSLAHIAYENGYEVGGYDRVPSALTRELEACGIDINYEALADNIDNFDIIVYTAAISKENPELARALDCDKAGTKYCIYRADFLGWLMSGYKKRIGVAGMHGKSTATAMISHIFMTAELDPTVVCGAVLDEIGGAYRVGSRDSFIMEACEYQDSFLSFTPNIAVVLNIDLDHTDYFSSIEQIRQSFAKYLDIAKDGYAVINADDANAVMASENYKGKKVFFSLNRETDYHVAGLRVRNGKYEFDIFKKYSFFAHIKLAVSGEHNMYDALAAAAVCDICGVKPEYIEKALADFTGAKRRMEFRGYVKGIEAKVPLYDDYAHHPTEIRATLNGARSGEYKRIVCVFQPHTYSRTSELFNEFASSFGGVHTVFADIYAAREVNTFGVTSEQLAEKAGGIYIPTLEKIAEYLKTELRDGDMLIVMGAGDIIRLDDLLL